MVNNTYNVEGIKETVHAMILRVNSHIGTEYFESYEEYESEMNKRSIWEEEERKEHNIIRILDANCWNFSDPQVFHYLHLGNSFLHTNTLWENFNSLDEFGGYLDAVSYYNFSMTCRNFGGFTGINHALTLYDLHRDRNWILKCESLKNSMQAGKAYSIPEVKDYFKWYRMLSRLRCNPSTAHGENYLMEKFKYMWC
jgi:hypothetical protein